MRSSFVAGEREGDLDGFSDTSLLIHGVKPLGSFGALGLSSIVNHQGVLLESCVSLRAAAMACYACCIRF